MKFRTLNSSFIKQNAPIWRVRNLDQRKPPVSEGQEVDVHIGSLGDKGDGVARVEGFVVFVPGTSKGENCRIKITKVLPKVAFGEKIGEAQSQPEQPAPRRAPKPVEEDIDFDSLGEGSEDFGEDNASEEADKKPVAE